MLTRFCFLLLLSVGSISCTQDTSELENELTSLQLERAKVDAELGKLKREMAAQPGLIHSVFFWLKDDLTEEQSADFRAGVESLREVPSIKAMFVGPVAPTEARGVVDNSYDIALLVHFADIAGQDAYQIDPIHLKFVEDHQDKWTKVVVYDSLVE